ncbi:unnamed protein product [Ectocarpus sp. 12 AP-2014]
MAMFAGTHRRLCALPDCQSPCFEDQDGFVHSYCSRTCSNEALARAKWASLRSSSRNRGGGSDGSRCKLAGCSRTVYIDERTGRVHEFCGISHANEAMANGERSSPSRGTAAGKGATANEKGTAECSLEGCKELVYRDPVTKMDSKYCSNRHYVAGMAMLNKECIRDGCNRAAWVDEGTGGVLDYCGSWCAGEVGMDHLVGVGVCSLPGCVKPNFVHPRDRQETGYCCEDHRLRATQRSLGPNPEPFVDRTFRGGTTSADDFQLSVLTNRHSEYLSRKQQFMQKWEKPLVGTGVSVLRIFKVQVPKDIRRRTETYMGQVGNVQRRFHGTSCSNMCTFFVDLRGGPCGESTCKVCNICTHGFRLRDNVGDTARRTNFDLRYGDGLYFSSVSGKANDYAEQSEKTDRSGKKVRCMFLSSVTVGRAFNTYEGKLPPEQCPPLGFDSVVGERGPALNYPEVVVYREEAALPTHLIVYGLHK